MTSFQLSKYSPRSNPSSSVEVSDGKAQYSVESNGTVTVLSNEWGNKGAQFKPPSSGWKSTITNLIAADSKNREAIEGVMGPEKIAEATSGSKSSGGSSPKKPKKELAPPNEKKPLYKQTWFWPVVVLGTATLAGGVYWYWTLQQEGEEHGEPVPA